MVKIYKKTPSEIMGIEDSYIAYCLNEAIAEFIVQIESGKNPRFKTQRKSKADNPGLKMLIG